MAQLDLAARGRRTKNDRFRTLSSAVQVTLKGRQREYAVFGCSRSAGTSCRTTVASQGQQSVAEGKDAGCERLIASRELGLRQR
jgi:hypothetical protein